MNHETHVTNFLWTGGWDSTFRLLQLLLLQNKTVQPHYLVDADRRSTGPELHAMRDIKREIFSRYPGTKDRLYPIKIVDIFDLPSDPSITESLLRIQKHQHLGSQYEWLAKYCKAEGLQDVELAAEEGGFLSKVIEPLLSHPVEDGETIYQMESRYQGTDEYNLFGYYRFPLIHLDKKGMQRIAWKEGLADIMLMTWFCHHPGRNFKPCGLCHPCSLTIEQGLGWRLPITSRMKYYFVKLVNKVLLIEKNPSFYKFARKIKHQFLSIRSIIES